uniref:Uncharacterized protein n=1 Tax=Arion vulgaris TaxID=1028688 RepID=A0A0B7BK10_9EUPU
MATHFYFWPILLITFLMVSSPLTSARDIAPREISLVKEPEENYYIVKKLPVVIVCQAQNAADCLQLHGNTDTPHICRSEGCHPY